MSLFENVMRAPVVITDGRIETRLIYEYRLPLLDFASFLPLFEADGQKALETIYTSYLKVAVEFPFPMQIGTPTWRAHPEGLARQGFRAPGDLLRVNAEAVRLLQALRRNMELEDRVVVAGVIGPRRDGYDPAGAPDAAAAQDYHARQAGVLAELGVDLLYAPTFASAEELLGVARAMAATSHPYALAPVIDGEGRMLDGTSIAEAVRRIDEGASARPSHFLIGCVYPTRFRQARTSAAWPVPDRIIGLKANASSLPPDQLDHLDHLEAGRPEAFADLMAGLHRDFGLKILGGCCGTSDRHIRALAQRLVAAAA